MAELSVLNQKISYIKMDDEDYISITDMLKSKDGDFFVSDWLILLNLECGLAPNSNYY